MTGSSSKAEAVLIDHHHCGDDNPGHPDYGDDNVNDGGGEMTMMVKRINDNMEKSRSQLVMTTFDDADAELS